MNLYLPKASKPFRWKKPAKDPAESYQFTSTSPPNRQIMNLILGIVDRVDWFAPGSFQPTASKDTLGLGATIKDA